MSKIAQRSENAGRLRTEAGVYKDGAYMGRVGTQLKEAMHAVSSIRRQAESALSKGDKR